MHDTNICSIYKRALVIETYLYIVHRCIVHILVIHMMTKYSMYIYTMIIGKIQLEPCLS